MDGTKDETVWIRRGEQTVTALREDPKMASGAVIDAGIAALQLGSTETRNTTSILHVTADAEAAVFARLQ